MLIVPYGMYYFVKDLFKEVAVAINKIAKLFTNTLKFGRDLNFLLEYKVNISLANNKIRGRFGVSLHAPIDG